MEHGPERFERCPKCGHAPLPREQALPAACPACGVILAKVGQPPVRRPRGAGGSSAQEGEGLRELLLHVPQRVDRLRFGGRAALLAAFALWGCVLIAQDHRTGEIGAAFLHRPLLVFHEAGHVVFGFAGEWMGVLGGTLGQLMMPLLMAGALLWRNRDPFGAALGLWLFGVSLLDVAPYMYDAWAPRLMLLSGQTGEEGFHDWVYLFRSVGLHARAQAIGGITHKLGAAVVLVSIGWAAAVLRRQYARIDGDVLREE